MILVTPDAHRTMCTSLGVSGHLREEDLPEDAIAGAKIVYLEGYLWDNEDTKNAFRAAMKIAKDAGCAVSLTLSDAFCVDRHRDSFLEIIDGPVDILFANEAELLSLYQTEDFDAAVDAVAKVAPLAVVTRSEKGCIVVSGDQRIAVEAEPIKQLVDTTGAGDQFAAGFFYGLVRKRDLETCARMGCASAAEVIQHMGPRPQTDMKALYAAHGWL
jgi:adenosine kinase